MSDPYSKPESTPEARPEGEPGKQQKPLHLVLASKLVLLSVAMFAFGYLVMPPLYRVICDITGLNGRTNSVAVVGPGEAAETERLVTVEFVSVINSSAAWSFKPAKHSMQVSPGKSYEAFYTAVNLTGRPAVGKAVPSVAPSSAAKYFNKIECFCFTKQEFNVGESKEMPLRFFVDPDLPRSIDTITLSYTYFDTGEEPVGLTDS